MFSKGYNDFIRNDMNCTCRVLFGTNAVLFQEMIYLYYFDKDQRKQGNVNVRQLSPELCKPGTSRSQLSEDGMHSQQNSSSKQNAAVSGTVLGPYIVS